MILAPLFSCCESACQCQCHQPTGIKYIIVTFGAIFCVLFIIEWKCETNENTISEMCEGKIPRGYEPAYSDRSLSFWYVPSTQISGGISSPQQCEANSLHVCLCTHCMCLCRSESAWHIFKSLTLLRMGNRPSKKQLSSNPFISCLSLNLWPHVFLWMILDLIWYNTPIKCICCCCSSHVP